MPPTPAPDSDVRRAGCRSMGLPFPRAAIPGGRRDNVDHQPDLDGRAGDLVVEVWASQTMRKACRTVRSTWELCSFLTLRGCLQSLELVLNLMNEPQIVPQRPDGRTVGDPRPPTPTSQARRPAPYSGPAGGSERHPVFASERLPLADGPARSASLADPVQPGFPILGVFRLKGQPKRDSGSIVRSCKATQSPVYPIRDAFAVVEHPSCPSSSSSCPLPVG